ncbi:MAG: hypothetical protein N2512_00090, partial [Armatimonadetes bacterium]|nr:hypothetical protein [Armatimonadota bacterium]
YPLPLHPWLLHQLLLFRLRPRRVLLHRVKLWLPRLLRQVRCLLLRGRENRLRDCQGAPDSIVGQPSSQSRDNRYVSGE